MELGAQVMEQVTGLVVTRVVALEQLVTLGPAAGLATAIPAVIFYNMFIHDIRDFASRMENFALEFQNLAERHYT